MRLSAVVALLYLCAAALAAAASVSETYAHLRDRSDLHAGFFDVKIPMRDGVTLSTIIILPLTAAKTYPAVMDRSPYGHFGLELLPALFLSYGYAAIGQDMRGTGESGGEFSMWRSDADDAYDTMEYLVSQPWSNKKVYQFGLSADGVATFVLGTNAHPALAGQSMIFATGTAHRTVFPGGAYNRGLVEPWIKKTVHYKEQAALMATVEANEAPGAWWDPVNVTDAAWGAFKHPSVVWGGWYDIFSEGSISGFQALQTRAAPAARGESYIVIDPLGHCQPSAKYFPRNLLMGRALLPIQLSMWNLGSRKAPVPQGVDKVTFYVMTKGALLGPGNYWTSLPDFPKFDPYELFLNEGAALVPAIPRAFGNLTYEYNPKNPVPTVGGGNLFLKCGPLEQTELSRRKDVLLFTTPELSEDLAITGPVFTRLFVSAANVNDTDFTAKLEDVDARGVGSLVVDGIVRMRWRHGERGGREPALMTPGEIYEVTVGMTNTSYIFPKGHRVRVSVSSSNAPRFDANYNNGLPLAEARKGPAITAINTVHFGGEFPSALILPRVDKSQIPPHKVGTELGGEMAAVCEMLSKLPLPLSQYSFMGSSEVTEAYAELCAVNKLFF
jgi:predicted acyl esterase